MKHTLLTLFLCTTLFSFGQANLIKDINLGNGSSSPKNKIVFKGIVYFPANDGINGSELWRTDGTEAGTEFFKEFKTGEDSGLTNLVAYATPTTLYFFAWDGTTNNALWKTDGTEAGTVKIKSFAGSFAVSEFSAAEVSDGIVFRARINNNHALWKTDGTEAGTIQLKNSDPKNIIKMDDDVFFDGGGLWKTDGTVSGTRLVKGNITSPREFFIVDNTLLFITHTATYGNEFWKTDGTEAGTVLVKDIITGGNGLASRANKAQLNNEVYFEQSETLWKTDGTDQGTVSIKPNLGIVKSIVSLNNKILVFAYDSSSQKQRIWVSDGTENGTNFFEPDVREFWHNGANTIVGNSLFFQAYNTSTGYELWKTDGTENGTFLVKDIHPEFDDNNIEDIVDFNGQAIFTASDGNWRGKELYISDGTENGTTLLKDINTEDNRSSSPKDYFQFGNKTLFSADNGMQGRELWVIENGVASLLKDINTGALYSNPSKFIELNGAVYFVSNTKEYGKELWKTDGTSNGTVLVKDINPNNADGVLEGNLITLNNKLYFVGDDGTTGFELWESDGTEAGTKLVSDVNGTSSRSIFNAEIAVLKNEVFFIADDGINGAELWKFDGTSTSLVKDINPNGGGNVRFLNVHPYLEKLYFSAYNGSETNLWESDGTSNTFKQSIKNPNNFTLSGSRDIGDRSGPNIIYNTELYFTGQSSSNFNNKGTELWAVTYIGTIQQVFDINPGSGHSYPSTLTDVNGKLYFKANDGTNGNELWRANGVIDAEMIKDINSGSGSVQITAIGGLGDNVFFNAPQDNISAPNYNYELWISDGTENGTRLFQDINPSTDQFQGGSNPSTFFETETTLYFTSNNGTTGSELWGLEKSALSTKTENIKDAVSLNLYPNPTSHSVNLNIDNQNIKSVQLFNILGKQVLNITNKEDGIKQINVSQLPAGMYVLQANSETASITKKIIKN